MVEPKRLHLAFFVPDLGGGGAERNVINISNVWAQSTQLDVEIVVCRKCGEFLEQVDKRVKITVLDVPRSWKVVWAFAQYLKRSRADAVIATLPEASLSAIIAKRISGYRGAVIVREASTVFDDARQSGSVLGRLYPKLVRWLYPSADGVLAISQDVRRRLNEGLVGRGGASIEVIHNPAVFPGLEERGVGPKPAAIDDSHHPKLVTVGRLDASKNQALVLNAVEKLRGDYPTIHLYIVGEGKEREALTRQLVRQNLTEHVSLVGFQNNPYVYVSHCDLFVLASRWEGFGNVVPEALALGLPAVVTDCIGGPKEVIHSDEVGVVVKSENLDSMVQGIRAALERKWDKAAILRRASDFRSDLVAAKYLAYVKTVMKA